MRYEYDIIYIDEETFTDEDWFDMIQRINEEAEAYWDEREDLYGKTKQ